MFHHSYLGFDMSDILPLNNRSQAADIVSQVLPLVIDAINTQVLKINSAILIHSNIVSFFI